MDYYERRDNVCDYQPEKLLDTTKTSSEIQWFLAGKSVLITGATGLIGSLLLENLLRTCPKIEKIYLVMRTKKEKSMEERLEALLASEVFFKVRRIHKNPAQKLHIISGDIALPWCGISEADKQLIIDNVDIVYHVAAALRMDEKLRSAYFMNVRATEDLLEIGTQMKKLKAFIYVSTAYSNPLAHDISEKFYDTEYSSEDLKVLIGLLKDEDLAALTPMVIGKWKNTYAFTKAIAEKVTQRYSDRLPVAVTRPSIVIGCEKDPLVAWINNIYGATGVSLAASVGIMRVWYGSNDKIADIIPADKVVTSIVAISWQIGKYHINGEKIETPVYNIVSSPKSPQTWRDYMTYTEQAAKMFQTISNKFIRTYDFHIEDRYWLYKIKVWVYHLLFGIIIDQIMKFKGKPPMLVKGFVKINNFNMALANYSQNEWVYFQNNMNSLWSEMSSLDKQIFNFDMTDFDWMNYHSRTIRGITVYILKDDFSQLKKSQERYLRTARIFFLLNAAGYGIGVYFLHGYLLAFYNSLHKYLL